MIKCFLIESTGRTVRALRRYQSDPNRENRPRCEASGLGYHTASASIDVVDASDVVSGDLWPHDDPRWPATCACGYTFQTGDQWQLFCQHDYRRADTGQLGTIQSFEPGAMWFAPWMADSKYHGKEHGALRAGQPHLIVKTPAGDWDIDSPSSNQNGDGWTRTGEAPNITARPSIGIGDPFQFHAFLTDGVLVEC
jgi:hypothetical protein